MSFAKRLEAVRDELRRSSVDAFILQRTDRHGSEYLPECEQRVAWLTGFTGSAATVAVTIDQAAVFSDGRYTVQLGEEVDSALFERCHLIDEPPRQWLEERLSSGSRLGHDAWLTKKAERKSLKAMMSRKGGELITIENPVDAVWKDRPAAPLAPVHALDIEYSGLATSAKRTAMARSIAKAGADALLVTATDHIAWLLNIRGNDIPFNPLCLSYLLLKSDGLCLWMVDPRKLGDLETLGDGIEIAPYDALDQTISSLSGKAVLVDPAYTHVGFIDILEAAGARVVEGDDPIVMAKAVKNDVEIRGAIAAQERDGAAMVRFLHWLDNIPHDGTVSEMDAVRQLELERAADPLYRGPSFDTISAHGPHAALPHYRVSDKSNRPLTAGTTYLVDSGGQYPDGTTDITRTIAMGEVSPEVKRTFTLVLKGHIALATALFPRGTSGAQLDTLARHPLWQAGLDFDHGTGHGIGAYLCVHEGPQRIARTGNVPLKPGMIVSNEPGYYKTGHFGIRIENLVVVEAVPKTDGEEREFHRFKTITLCPIDRRMIDMALLDTDEKQWLDTYHERVRSRLLPLINEAACRAWFERATAPLA
ncbi:MAG: aminopeptidase P family protein [Geminicoccaceae bacterium]|nr:aminopeptidase P family protein [Geminicoccaceae bacterium]